MFASYISSEFYGSRRNLRLTSVDESFKKASISPPLFILLLPRHCYGRRLIQVQALPPEFLLILPLLPRRIIAPLSYIQQHPPERESFRNRKSHSSIFPLLFLRR